MRTFYKLTIIYITITFVLIGFFISSNVFFLNKPITLNYNKFRIEYADIINTIKNRETSFNSTKLSKLLDTKEVQLCLYDLTTDDIFFKYGSYVSNIDKSNLELYMVHDHGIAKSIDSSKYLLNFIYFNENKPSILGIFVVNRDILFSELNKDKIALSHNILGFIVVCVIITFCYLLLLLFKIIIPMKQLESITKTISNGDFHKDISYRLQQGSLGKCYTELEHMRKNLLEYSTKLRDNELNRKELINYLTHDLRTPITSIRALCEGLLDGVASTKEKKIKYLNGILNKTDEMERLSNDLFHHANIELNNFSIEKTDAYIDDVFNDIFDSCRIVLESYDGSYSLINDLPHMLISIDSFRMEQAIINLLTNSIKYSKQNTEITINAYYNDPFFIIQIKDTGMGISKEDIPFIFDPFFRGEKSRSRKYGGTGLGLSIVKNIIELHDATIKVSSIVGEYTVFTIKMVKG